MSFGDVDTLALIFDKLNYIFRGYEPYIQDFTAAQNLYKQGKLQDREYFGKIGDAVLKYSALEFLNLKALFEIKKSMDRLQNPSRGGMAVPGVQTMSIGNNPVSLGRDSVGTFISSKNLPSRDEMIRKINESQNKCSSCGSPSQGLKKFCTNCGNKL